MIESESDFSTFKVTFYKNFPPNNKIVMRVLENKNLFAGHEIDYMENNTKTSIKDNSYYEEIEKKHLKKAKKWL